VASFPHVKSPFGLLDAAGGMAEWLEEGPTLPVYSRLLGGSPYVDDFNDEPYNADRPDYYFSMWIDGTSSWTGFRLAGAVPCLPDLDAPLGTLDQADLAAYLDLFQSAHPSADLAEPHGVLNFFDLAAYLNAFHAGCP
jgi:hypothetical protein